jgi:hypothetical protein
VRWASVGSRIHDFPRGGGSQDSDDGYEQDDEEDSDDSEYDEESDEESAESDEQTNEEVEEEVEEKEGKVSTKSKAKKKKATRIVDGAAVEYDEPLVASPFLNLYVSLGIMFLAKKVNLLSPLMVRIARYVSCVQSSWLEKRKRWSILTRDILFLLLAPVVLPSSPTSSSSKRSSYTCEFRPS